MRSSFFLIVFLVLAGCQQSGQTSNGRLSAPANGSARLMVAKVKETADTVHYQWSLLGDRNWTTPTVTPDGKAVLAEVYPLNDTGKT